MYVSVSLCQIVQTAHNVCLLFVQKVEHAEIVRKLLTMHTMCARMYMSLGTRETTTQTKGNKKMNFRKFETLTKSEIKKINKAGKGKVGEYYTTASEVEGFMDVTASVFDNEYENIIATVKMSICLFDRRKSWVWKVVAA